ncbi:DUF1707 SHOCT-like domain-containing protein [Phytohabitans rumicis]|uniref:DUF1707 SHOCT-like domain-containing protein n=1 Tax=Phytohabitans rumicis TaxID=1076125 RepID=UPI0015662217|nr:DUF1707 domain-containing protein [Phytohabitans rumicis]
MSADIRASDDDRHRVVDALQRHTEVGRLTLDEFAERVSVVYAARTLGELAAVTHDLPVAAATPADTGRRDLLILFAIAAAALVLLGLYVALFR